MEKDELKSFIQSNKEAFEDELPSDLWHSVSRSLDAKPEPKMIRLSTVYRITAVAAILLMVFTVVYLRQFERNLMSKLPQIEQKVTDQSEEGLVLATYSPELKQLEVGFIEQERSLEESLKSKPGGQELIAEVQMLRDDFDKLKIEMETTLDKEAVIQAMIENYRLRIELLEQLLLEMNKYENGIEI